MWNTVTITPVLNGWVAKAEGYEVVFNKKEDLLEALGAYMDDPAATVSQFRAGSVNSKLFFPWAVEPAPVAGE